MYFIWNNKIQIVVIILSIFGFRTAYSAYQTVTLDFVEAEVYSLSFSKKCDVFIFNLKMAKEMKIYDKHLIDEAKEHLASLLPTEVAKADFVSQNLVQQAVFSNLVKEDIKQLQQEISFAEESSSVWTHTHFPR